MRGARRLISGILINWGAFGIGIIVACVLLAPPDRFFGWAVLPASIATVLALVGGQRTQSQIAGVVLNSRPFQFLGKLSYSWYLWHWPFIVFAKLLWPGEPAAVLLAVAGWLLVMSPWPDFIVL